MSSTLENEDLHNGPLVRMEDVQPARDRPCEVFKLVETKNEPEPVETYIVDDLDYDNECVVDDDDSNIGSMVSIHSEDVLECEDCNNSELNMSEVQPAKSTPVKLEVSPKVESKTPESWPTLEILPGGVIKNSDKCEEDSRSIYQDLANESENDDQDMMYACAKCSQSFKYLFSLVKHVRGHEKEQKKLKTLNLTNLKPKKDVREYIWLHKTNKNVLRKTIKRKVPKKYKS